MNESKKKDRYEDAKKFVRYSDGAKMYSMGMTKFQEVAKDAKACYKIGQLVLVNTEILDKYLETFHITDSEFYKQVTNYKQSSVFLKNICDLKMGNFNRPSENTVFQMEQINICKVDISVVSER